MDEQLRFRPGVRVEHRDDGTTRLYRDRGGISVGRLDPAIGQVLDLLAAGPCAEDELTTRVLDVGAELRLFDLHLLLHRLRAGGWLDRILTRGGEPVLTVRPVSQHSPAPVKQSPGPVRLSRFVILRPDGGDWLMESPLAHVQLLLQDPGLITTSLACAGNAVTDVLLEYGFAVTGEEDFARQMWAPHELWFHARSRACGTTCRTAARTGRKRSPASPR